MEQTEKQFRSPPNAGQGILVEAGRDSARAAARRFAPRNLKNAFAQPPGKPRQQFLLRRFLLSLKTFLPTCFLYVTGI
jgi:hypothetical protein